MNLSASVNWHIIMYTLLVLMVNISSVCHLRWLICWSLNQSSNRPPGNRFRPSWISLEIKKRTSAGVDDTKNLKTRLLQFCFFFALAFNTFQNFICSIVDLFFVCFSLVDLCRHPVSVTGDLQAGFSLSYYSDIKVPQSLIACVARLIF